MTDADTVLKSVRVLTDEYRQRCLWFLRADYYPTTPAEALRVLGYIERRGDLEAFRKAAPLKRWLLQHTSGQSAA